MASCVCPVRKSLQLLLPPDQHLVMHKPAHNRCHHRLCTDSVASSTLQSWLHTITLTPIWSSVKTLARTPLQEWPGTVECCALVAGKEGEQLYHVRIHAFQQKWKTVKKDWEYIEKQLCLQQYCSRVVWNFQNNNRRCNQLNWNI